MPRGPGDERRRQLAALVAVFIAALIAGIVVGWVFRRWAHPTIEERSRDLMHDVGDAIRKLTR